MKIIVSHDVDHITFWEHNNDLVIPKFITRYFIELTLGIIPINEFIERLKRIIRNKWHNLDDLMSFNKENDVPATFFLGVSNGKGLVYSQINAAFWIKKIIQSGFDAGVHGIAFDNYEMIKQEHDTFKAISGLDEFGIRMHYLRTTENTIDYLNKAGYLFDTTLYEFSNPYQVKNLWEFPLFIMDVYIIRKDSRVQNQNLKQAKEATKKIIDDVNDNGIGYLTVNLHDRFFHDSFKTWKEWYIWLITYLKDNHCKFISYREAISELEGIRSKNTDAIHVLE